MAKKKKLAVRYRDRNTGKFVSEKTWKRSRAHGGKRYRRERSRKTKPRRIVRPRKLPKPARLTKEKIEEIIKDEKAEYGGAFDSSKKK